MRTPPRSNIMARVLGAVTPGGAANPDGLEGQVPGAAATLAEDDKPRMIVLKTKSLPRNVSTILYTQNLGGWSNWLLMSQIMGQGANIFSVIHVRQADKKASKLRKNCPNRQNLLSSNIFCVLTHKCQTDVQDLLYRCVDAYKKR